jgi:hypothetical protein
LSCLLDSTLLKAITEKCSHLEANAFKSKECILFILEFKSLEGVQEKLIKARNMIQELTFRRVRKIAKSDC